MIEWLAVWGVGQFIFRPILEELAKDVAKDAAKSYVGQCFKSVFSVIHKDPLSKATGLALKELLELIESELVRADIEDEELFDWILDVRRFTVQDEVRGAISSLFLEPDTHLDPKTFQEHHPKTLSPVQSFSRHQINQFLCQIIFSGGHMFQVQIGVIRLVQSQR